MKRFAISIGIKIFGISSSMLALLLGVAYINHRNIALVNHELFDLANYLTKLTESVAQINIHALEQEIHYERVVRILETEPVDRAALTRELDAFEERNDLVDEELAQAIDRADEAIERVFRPKDAIEFARVKAFLEVLEVDHQNFHDNSLEIVELFEADERAEAEVLERQLEQFEDDFDRRIQSILFELGTFTEAAAVQAGVHEARALRVSWVLAAIATGVGLTFASLLTFSLVRPIQRLVAGTREVDRGNLDVEVPVASGDEVGQLATTFNAMVADIQSKERIKATFGQYVDPRIVERLIDSSGEATTPTRSEMTVFFSDMAGFSALSELLTPTGLVKLIDRYLTLASEPILAHNGIIDRYIGDAVTAFWGAPFVTDADRAKLACFAALEQLSQLVKLRRLLPEIMGIRKGLPEIRIRVGLATGELVAGNIGSDRLKSYTVLGQPVRTAEHLESASKQYGTTILLDETTRQAAADAIETRAIDIIRVPGSAVPIAIHELMDAAGNLTPVQAALRDRFNTGIAAYRDRNWEAARREFVGCVEVAPGDRPSRIYLNRLDRLAHSPPHADWDGVWVEA